MPLPQNIFRRVAPTGNCISLANAEAWPALHDERVRLVQSGTAALAAAVLVARKSKKVEGKPQVVVPAYCCPDVLSAILYNDCSPVLVDLQPNRPFMNLDEVAGAITPNTIAVIAINFLGIPERCKELRQITAKHGIVLIEDSAQWFPEGDLFEAYEGDLVVLSFGKGKPVSLLGGGAVICRNPALAWYELKIDKPLKSQSSLWIRMQFAAYNLVIRPQFYWLLEILPFLELGATKYKTLENIGEMEPKKIHFLMANIRGYKLRDRRAQLRIHDWLRSTGRSHLIPVDDERVIQDQKLLRFPILAATAEQRDQILSELQQLGFGASPLYEMTVDKVRGVPLQQGVIVRSSKYAEDFARRLITLPTHNFSWHGRAFERAMNTIVAVRSTE